MDGPEIQTSGHLNFDLLGDTCLLCSFGLVMPCLMIIAAICPDLRIEISVSLSPFPNGSPVRLMQCYHMAFSFHFICSFLAFCLVSRYLVLFNAALSFSKGGGKKHSSMESCKMPRYLGVHLNQMFVPHH